MRKLLVIAAVAMVSAGLFIVPATATAAHVTPRAVTGSFKDGPYSSTSTDSSTCGNDWAQDLFVRTFVVKLPAGTVTEKFLNGHFVTTPGASPGGCDTNPGGTVPDGIDGTFKGTFTVVPIGGTFNPNGTCVLQSFPGEIPQCTTADWVAGFFPGSTGYTVTHFNFVYKASGIAHTQWTNADTGNIGDIAS